ncbi:unnamed protein product, partial [Mesorhabditis spiculigera]
MADQQDQEAKMDSQAASTSEKSQYVLTPEIEITLKPKVARWFPRDQAKDLKPHEEALSESLDELLLYLGIQDDLHFFASANKNCFPVIPIERFQPEVHKHEAEELIPGMVYRGNSAIYLRGNSAKNHSQVVRRVGVLSETNQYFPTKTLTIKAKPLTVVEVELVWCGPQGSMKVEMNLVWKYSSTDPNRFFDQNIFDVFNLVKNPDTKPDRFQPFKAYIYLLAKPDNLKSAMWIIGHVVGMETGKKKRQAAQSQQIPAGTFSETPTPSTPPADPNPTGDPAVIMELPDQHGVVELWDCVYGKPIAIPWQSNYPHPERGMWVYLQWEGNRVSSCTAPSKEVAERDGLINFGEEKGKLMALNSRLIRPPGYADNELCCLALNACVIDEDRSFANLFPHGFSAILPIVYDPKRQQWFISTYTLSAELQMAKAQCRSDDWEEHQLPRYPKPPSAFRPPSPAPPIPEPRRRQLSAQAVPAIPIALPFQPPARSLSPREMATVPQNLIPERVPARKDSGKVPGKLEPCPARTGTERIPAYYCSRHDDTLCGPTSCWLSVVAGFLGRSPPQKSGCHECPPSDRSSNRR